MSFVLSMDSRDQSDIEYPIERLRSMSIDDERLAICVGDGDVGGLRIGAHQAPPRRRCSAS